MEENQAESDDSPDYYGSVTDECRDLQECEGMHRIEEETYDLVAAIKESREYSQYHWLYSEIKKNGELLGRLNAFRKRRFELELSGTEDGLEAQRRLAEEFHEILMDPLIAQFLSAEYTYCKMVRQAVYRVTECLDLEIDFLEG